VKYVTILLILFCAQFLPGYTTEKGTLSTRIKMSGKKEIASQLKELGINDFLTRQALVKALSEKELDKPEVSCIFKNVCDSLNSRLKGRPMGFSYGHSARIIGAFKVLTMGQKMGIILSAFFPAKMSRSTASSALFKEKRLHFKKIVSDV